PVAGEAKGSDLFGISKELSQFFALPVNGELLELFTRGHFPKADRLTASRGQRLAVRGKSEREGAIGMPKTHRSEPGQDPGGKRIAMAVNTHDCRRHRAARNNLRGALA